MPWDVTRIPDGEPGIDATVARMRRIVRDAIQDPRLALFAQDLTLPAGSGPSTRVVEEVAKFVRNAWYFRGDPINQELPVELIKTPDRLLSEFASRRIMVGDCDDASVLIAALLSAVGYPTRFVVVQRNRNVPPYARDADLHIYVEAWSQGRWVSIDGVAKGRPLLWQPEGEILKRYATN